MDAAATRKQLRIKSGSAKRLYKEQNMYRDEVEDQKRKLDKLVADGAEEWDVKNAKKMLEESKKMVVDADTRLGKTVADLRDLVVLAKRDPAFAEDEQLIAAEEALETVSV
ncbi:tubulin binding cofactor A [Stereum hirsutum FP-91666 SS1]|uniref:tubulin binding cofactor A n=1 Tax=Stereum hirsutum (strain FP-91666) TaxID=721885 RepID=UPI000440B027|nr:tubulin binding cofactor A [Stereum hirsutum FP-91666 SS1]EIM92695.1 tubulin binding cofactor A [Stereum hirsutum FP-91666 SS1]